MNPSVLIAILGGICTVLVSVSTWGFLSGKFASGVEQRAARLADELRDYKAETARRFDEANDHLSKAMSHVQTLESRMLREFASRDLMDTRFAEMRRELDYLRTAVDRRHTSRT